MKINSAFALAVMLSTTHVQASEMCTALHGLGDQMMYARQEGVSMVQSFEIIEDNLKTVPELLTVARLMVKDAYGVSRYSSEKFKKEAQSEFANKWMLLCLKELD